MTLSNTVYDHVIVFVDKSTKFITESQSALILQASCSTAKQITTPALGMITFSSIAKILKVADFYDQYPDKRPAIRPEFAPEPRQSYQTIEEQALGDKNRRSAMVIGLERFITQSDARGELVPTARAILKDWKNN